MLTPAAREPRNEERAGLAARQPPFEAGEGGEYVMLRAPWRPQRALEPHRLFGRDTGYSGSSASALLTVNKGKKHQGSSQKNSVKGRGKLHPGTDFPT